MKLAVILPGVGYHTDKPLLYYSKKAAAALGYEVKEVHYGGFPKDVKDSTEKRLAAFDIALSTAEETLKDVDFAKYGEVLFISKSLGTVVSAAYEEKYSLSARNIFYTPVEETFSHGKHGGIAFHGTSDRWAETAMVKEKCAEQGIELHITEGANHSLETGDALKDIENLAVIMKTSIEYMK